MGVDFHEVCKCGSHHSEYVMRTGMRHCRNCGALLSIDGIFQESSPCFGLSREGVLEYFKTGKLPVLSAKPDKNNKEPQ